ncbi:MAG: hypothetical protein KUG81_10625 [Gammaproteobacteria bacterium]|nr:hypothetical protein [Gammaproteobacteria bacterium]
MFVKTILACLLVSTLGYGQVGQTIHHSEPQNALQGSSFFSGEDSWTGEITRVRENAGGIEAIKFVGVDGNGDPVDEWVCVPALTDAQAAVIRRLRNTGATDVIIGVEDNAPGEALDKKYTKDIEYSVLPPA